MAAGENEEKAKTQPVSGWRVVLSCFIALFIAIGFTVLYINHVQAQAVAAQRASDARAAQARRDGLKNTCTILEKIKITYEKFDTPNALAVADTWNQLEILVGCATLK